MYYINEELVGENQLKNYHFLKSIQEVLAILHVQKELHMESINKETIDTLKALIESVINNNPINAEFENPNCVIEIGNLQVLVHIEKERESGIYMIKDYFSKSYLCHGKTTNGESISAPMGVMLNRNMLLAIDNVDFEEITNDLKIIKKTDVMLQVTFDFLLETLHAYDLAESEEKRISLIKGAAIISDWLYNYDNYTLDAVLELNKLQIIKRKRELDESEKDTLYRIIEDSNQPEDVLTAAYILLDNPTGAERHFQKIDKEKQPVFLGYPICLFWKNKK